METIDRLRVYIVVYLSKLYTAEYCIVNVETLLQPNTSSARSIF